jgi:hypothetical protein
MTTAITARRARTRSVAPARIGDKRDSTEAHLTIVFAALPKSR